MKVLVSPFFTFSMRSMVHFSALLALTRHLIPLAAMRPSVEWRSPTLRSSFFSTISTVSLISAFPPRYDTRHCARGPTSIGSPLYLGAFIQLYLPPVLGTAPLRAAPPRGLVTPTAGFSGGPSSYQALATSSVIFETSTGSSFSSPLRIAPRLK